MDLPVSIEDIYPAYLGRPIPVSARKEAQAKPSSPGAWKARHYDAPDMFAPDGSWRPGVDRMAL